MKLNNRSPDSFMAKLLSVVLPIAFQQFMLALVSATDALMLGKLTQDSLSAVSLASQVVFVENLILTAMTIGLSIFAAQYRAKTTRKRKGMTLNDTLSDKRECSSVFSNLTNR